MVLQISTYVDPGVYIGEVVVPGAINIATTPTTAGIIGIGDRTKRITNEAVTRALIEDESLTLVAPTGTGDSLSAPALGLQTLTDATGLFGSVRVGARIAITGATNPTNNGTFTVVQGGTTTLIISNPAGVVEVSSFTWQVVPHVVLAERSDKRLQNTDAFRNGTLIGDNFLRYLPGVILGTAAGTYDVRVATGTGDSFAFGAGIVTLTDAAALFTPNMVGSTITVVGATSPANDGTYLVASVPTTSTLTFANPAGVAEAFVGTWHVSDAAFALEADGIRAVTLRLQHTVSTLSGTGDSFVFAVGIVTLTDAAAAFSQSLIGTTVEVSSATSSGNNGTFVIASVPSATTLTYANAAGVTEAFPGTYTMRCQVIGREIRIQAVFSGLGGSAATRAEVAAAINRGLPGATTLGFGGTYASFARDITTGIQLTSPNTTFSSDVRVFAPFAHSYLIIFFGAAAADNRDARSVLEVSRLVYSATAVYTLNYIDLDSNEDELVNAGVQEIIGVGSTAGVSNFLTGVDYVQDGDSLDWGGVGNAPDTAPVFTGSDASPYNLTTNDNLSISFDGLAAVTIDLKELVSPPLGYANPLAFGAATAAEVANNINSIIGNNAAYGPRYNAVASAVVVGASTFVQLTSPTEGLIGTVTITAPAALDATTEVLGLQSTQLPLSTLGVGKRPALAAVYFATYSITRATSEYAAQKRFFSLDQARADLGQTTANNPLMLAMELVFANRAPSAVAVQVNDASSPGSPTRTEFLASLDATLKTDIITDVVCISTDLAVQTDLKDHIEYASSPTVKRYRRGWFGMARNTPIGDKDTADTYVFRARRTLQVASDSSGRGRMILVAPPQLSGVSRDITLEDASVQRVNLDTTYLAAAIAGKKSSFTSPAASMARKSVTGFNVDDVTDVNIWLPTERGLLAGQGSMVVTFDAGVFKILDPVTTEVGGGGLAKFSYESTSSQKDNITRKVDQALDANIIGIVPTDLADFIVDIKIIVRNVLSGEIGTGAIAPFRNADGTTRGIDLTTDIEVEQDPNDPTKFFFKYAFNLRYPALRLFGEFSVDNFAAAA
jgi:hypothetical protein